MRHDVYSLACVILAGMVEAVRECDTVDLPTWQAKLKLDGLALHRGLGFKEISKKKWGEWVDDRCPEKSFCLTK